MKPPALVLILAFPLALLASGFAFTFESSAARANPDASSASGNASIKTSAGGFIAELLF